MTAICLPSVNIYTSYIGGPLIGRPLIGRNSLQDGFCLFSKFYNSSHSTALLLSTLIGLFIKKILYFLRPMRGPPVPPIHYQQTKDHKIMFEIYLVLSELQSLQSRSIKPPNKSFPVMLYNKEESNVLLLKRPLLLLCMDNLHQVNQIYRTLAEEPK